MGIEKPKYSIIIPARNGVSYLPACVETIINQGYCDYELIISDDHSNDGTKEYLNTLSQPNIRVIEPPEALSMAEHWEWALSHARGEWLVFVGQDDGLQPYFFQLSDLLTEVADRKDVRVVMSERAYYFWEGCGLAYGDIAVRYSAVKKVRIHHCKLEAIKALLGVQHYFELPQMYTTSLFKKSILEEAQSKQGGKVFVSHPQDANLGAVACSLENTYLKSYIPLGWVGTSPKSAGMAIRYDAQKGKGGSDDINGLSALKLEYEAKVAKSNFKYPHFAGNFSFGNTSIYFWQALLQTQSLRSASLNRILRSRAFKLIMFGSVLAGLILNKKLSTHKEMFIEILGRNGCNYAFVFVVSLFVLMTSAIWAVPDLIFRAFNKAKHLIFGSRVSFKILWSGSPDMDMMKASNCVMELLVKKEWIKPGEQTARSNG